MFPQIIICGTCLIPYTSYHTQKLCNETEKQEIIHVSSNDHFISPQKEVWHLPYTVYLVPYTLTIQRNWNTEETIDVSSNNYLNDFSLKKVFWHLSDTVHLIRYTINETEKLKRLFMFPQIIICGTCLIPYTSYHTQKLCNETEKQEIIHVSSNDHLISPQKEVLASAWHRTPRTIH